MNHTFKQHIIFDLDDTLIHCNKYFGLVLGEFFELMHHWLGAGTFTTDEIRQKQIDIDVERVSRTGFSSGNFPKSLIETYRFFCRKLGRPVRSEEELELNKLGLSVYERDVEPYPGMVETLETLQKDGHRLYLYTGGETKIQQRKIDQMKLSDYFGDRIYITQHKNEATLENILQSGAFDRICTWMIGNSLRTDVAPALSAGLNSIYIRQDNEWAFNMVELKQKPDSSFYTISSIEEIPGIVERKVQEEQKQRALN
ncbi:MULTISPECIES: HAD family hydrolase [Paenibacillus]|uniref:Haloacid dehalogenase n=1 Tax=Paenibacillus albilobatus TaxID=2716884 RepID=A0A919XFF2_9BACL|nr:MULTISPECIES: HAD family hydrolase [Paenibacillus]GIO31186.1 haloacid dehalogenase [Paenibacillus albilobatus]